MTTRTIISWYTNKLWENTLRFNNLWEVWPSSANIKISDKIIKIISDKSEKVCIWRYDILTWDTYTCPDKAKIDKKYENCVKCREYNWFNPAFYNTNKLSDKQEKYNMQPHDVYLAHFWNWIVKVWISNHERTQIRLKEQWARTAIILWSFSNAENARKIESEISSVDWIKETIQNITKIKCIIQYYDESIAKNDIKKAVDKINKVLGYDFSLNEIYHYDEVYFPSHLDTINFWFKDISDISAAIWSCLSPA